MKAVFAAVFLFLVILYTADSFAKQQPVVTDTPEVQTADLQF